MDNNKKSYVIIVCLIIIIMTCLFAIFMGPNKSIKTTTKGEEYFHNYKVNEIQRVYVSIEEISNIYLSELVSMVVNEPKKLYTILDKETKNKYASYDDYLHMIDMLKTRNFLNSIVVKYSQGVLEDKNAIYVIDKAGNTFIFIENSINNYKVRIN